MTEEETMDAGALREALAKLPHWRVMGSDLIDRNAVLGILAGLDEAAAAREPVAPAEAEPDILAMTTWPGYERHQHADGSWCQRKVDAALAQPPVPVSAETAWEALTTDMDENYDGGSDEFATPGEGHGSYIARHRPAIEAAIRKDAAERVRAEIRGEESIGRLMGSVDSIALIAGMHRALAAILSGGRA